MSDAIISVVAERVLSILEEQIRYEVNLVRGVEKEVLDLSKKLETIRTVLDDAEKRGVKEQGVKKWLKKLENTAYEMDDILDEWHYALVKHKMEHPAKEKVCCSFIPSPSSSCLCFKKLGVRHNIGIKIRDVKATLDEVLIEKDQFKFVTSLPSSNVEPRPPRVQSTSSIELAKVHGVDIHRNKNEIVRRLMDNGSSELLSIVGMGGLGKTTLAQLVYNDSGVKDSFKLSIWICVSDPFDVDAIARGIVESVTKEVIPRDTNQLELVLRKLRDSISGKKFLLVLDDVWTEKYQEWEPLKINLGHGAAGSKILVTSRNVRVAKMMGSTDHQIHYPQHLTDDECWLLLRRISLPGRSEEECGEFEGVGKKIAGKCKGLPLAANVLGSLLQFKNSLEEWENVWKSEIWELEEAEVDLFPHLLLSYNELSPALKRCFSYCAVYPKGSEIDAKRLIEEWMALGYLGSLTGKNGGVEVKGRDYFNNLAMRSLFQDVVESDEGEINQCKMHDIVHDFALFLRGNNDRSEEKGKSSCQVCSPPLVCRGHEHRSLVWGEKLPMNVCDCLASVRVLKFKRIVNGPPQGMKKLIHLRLLDLFLKSIHLRLLDLFRTPLSEEFKIICRLYFLQTLLLSDCSLKKIPIEIGNLVELRHLDLSQNEKLKELPREIGNLVELRHLDLSYNMGLKELPREIGNLVELRHLNLSYNKGLKELPREIGNLVELRHLNLSYNKGLKELPREIGNLVELRHLDLSYNMGLKELPREIGNLVELRHLNLSYNKGLKELPREIGNLVELRHLDLSYNMGLKELPREIGNLVELRHLNLSYNKGLKELPREIGNLVELRHLDLSYNNELKELVEEIENLVQLRILNLNICDNLQGLPEGIHRLRNLQRLLIAGTPASRHLPRGLGELSGLRTLETDFYGGSGCNKLGLLKKLNCLRGSLDLEIKINSSISDFQEVAKDAQEAELRRKDHIHTLRIQFDSNEDEVEGSSSSSSLWMDVMEALEPNLQKLNELTILAYEGSRLPQWISSPLSRVKEISLKYCYELSSLPPFGKLPFLEFFSMDNSNELKFVGREFLGIESLPSSSTKEVVAFPKLKLLSISGSWAWTEWEDITAEEEESSIVSILPCLEKLEARYCSYLKKLPHRLLRKVSPSLRILNIVGSRRLKTRYVDKDGSEWRSISLNNPQLELISYY